MNNPVTTKLLNFVSLSGVDCRALDMFIADKSRSFEPHQDVIEEGERPDHINFVLSGWACRYKHLEDGRRQIIAFLLPDSLMVRASEGGVSNHEGSRWHHRCGASWFETRLRHSSPGGE